MTDTTRRSLRLNWERTFNGGRRNDVSRKSCGGKCYLLSGKRVGKRRRGGSERAHVLVDESHSRGSWVVREYS